MWDAGASEREGVRRSGAGSMDQRLAKLLAHTERERERGRGERVCVCRERVVRERRRRRGVTFTWRWEVCYALQWGSSGKRLAAASSELPQGMMEGAAWEEAAARHAIDTGVGFGASSCLQPQTLQQQRRLRLTRLDCMSGCTPWVHAVFGHSATAAAVLGWRAARQGAGRCVLGCACRCVCVRAGVCVLGCACRGVRAGVCVLGCVCWGVGSGLLGSTGSGAAGGMD